MTDPKVYERLRIARLSPRQVTNNLCRQIAAVLHHAVWPAPWALRWAVGCPSDPPVGDTCCGYVNEFRRQPGALFFVLHAETGAGPEEDDVKVQTSKAVGYIFGAPFTEELIAATHMDRGIDPAAVRTHFGNEAATTPLVGDFYYGVVMIQGPIGADDCRLQDFRHRTIDGMKVFRHLTRMLFSTAAYHGHRRLWVRTHPNQPAVLKVCREWGCHVVGKQHIQQGETSAPRIVMLAELEPCADPTATVSTVWKPQTAARS